MSSTMKAGFVRDDTTGALVVAQQYTKDPSVPTGAIDQTFPRQQGLALTSVISSGTLRLSGLIRVPARQTVNSITFWSGSTALATGTHQWFGLFDATSFAKLALTVDDLANAWAASAAKTLNLSAPWTPTVDTIVNVGICVVATTPPTMLTPTTGAWSHLLTVPIVGGNSSAALVDPASCPATVNTPVVGNPPCYAYIS